MSQSKKPKNTPPTPLNELLNIKDTEISSESKTTSEFTSLPEAHISFKHLLMLETFRSVVSQLKDLVHSADDVERCKKSVHHILKTAISASLECEVVYNEYFNKAE